MEKKYLEIYVGKDQLLTGAFENVKNFEESENHLSFDSDEGHFEIDKDEFGWWTTRVFGQPVQFSSYKLVGRRTVLKKVDANRLGHSKEQKQKYDDQEAKAEATRIQFEQDLENGNLGDLTEDDVRMILDVTDRFTKNIGTGFVAYRKEDLKPIANRLHKYYQHVDIRHEEKFYYIFFDGLRNRYEH